MAAVKTESSGGVVAMENEVLLCFTTYPDPQGRWTLPKGIVEPGETPEDTALREVEEETGIKGEVVRPLGQVAYSFTHKGVNYDKVVHYFLMRPSGGDISRHDREMEEVRWVPLREAIDLLPFDNEKGLLRKLLECREA